MSAHYFVPRLPTDPEGRTIGRIRFDPPIVCTDDDTVDYELSAGGLRYTVLGADGLVKATGRAIVEEP